jgi:hypothetical protein
MNKRRPESGPNLRETYSPRLRRPGQTSSSAVEHRVGEREAMVEEVLKANGGGGFAALLASPRHPFRLGNVGHAEQDIGQGVQHDLRWSATTPIAIATSAFRRLREPMMAAMSTKSRHCVFALPRSTAVTIFPRLRR